jgi:hypothetical protein
LRDCKGQPDHKAGRAKKAIQGRRDRRVRKVLPVPKVQTASQGPLGRLVPPARPAQAGSLGLHCCWMPYEIGCRKPTRSDGAFGGWPSGKAALFDSAMRRFESSRPSQAVLVFGSHKRRPRNRPRFRGILAVRLSLRAPFCPLNGQGAPEISGGTLKYSQFSQMHAGDGFDLRLPGRGAIDPLTGMAKWEAPSDIPRFSGVLSTGGGVVFSGQLTGEFEAFDADTGKKLWQFQTGLKLTLRDPLVRPVNTAASASASCTTSSTRSGGTPRRRARLAMSDAQSRSNFS